MKINTHQLTENFLKYLKNLTNKEWGTKVTDGWTIKEEIAHLIGWEKEAAKELPIAWKKHRRPWFMENNDDFARFNAKNTTEYKEFTPRQLIIEWKKWQKVFEDEISKIGEDKLRADYDFFEWVFDESGQGHYLEHFNQIKKALNKF
ncbi:MAG: DinB family protein [Candidatus Woesebacteria bacterium]|nr:DinB family protein [Candidatus Woesebacteria bacterium]